MCKIQASDCIRGSYPVYPAETQKASRMEAAQPVWVLVPMPDYLHNIQDESFLFQFLSVVPHAPTTQNQQGFLPTYTKGQLVGVPKPSLKKPVASAFLQGQVL